MVIVPPNVGATHENVSVPELNDKLVGAPGADKSVCELPPLLCVTYPFTKYVSCSSTSIDTISTSLCSISIDVIGTSTKDPLSALINLSSVVKAH